jgi:molybdate transport system substrate-binding protein
MPDKSLTVLTTVALKGVLERVAPEFAKATGFGIASTFAPAGVVIRRMRDGASADVLVVTPDTWPVLEKDGLGAPGTGRDIASSVIGVAVKAGAPHPKIGSAEEFRQTLIDAKSIAFTDPATGAASVVHFMQLAEQWGIADQVRAKGVLGDGGPVAEFVAQGRAEIAVQQLSEHKLIAGVEVVGALPAAMNKTTTFTAGVAARAAHPKEAAALIALMCAPHVQRVMPEHGLQGVAASPQT